MGKKELAVAFAAERTIYSAQRARQLYDWTVKRLEAIKLMPDLLGVWAPNYPKAKYRGFHRGRAKLERTDFSTIRGIWLDRKRPDWSDGDQENRSVGWTLHINHGRPASDRTCWMFDTTSVEMDQVALISHLRDYAKEATQTYGYIYCGPRKDVVRPYGAQAGVASRYCATPDEATNMGPPTDYPPPEAPLLLRDVHMVNFLSLPFLKQPAFGTTLEGWIGADEARGTLMPLTRSIWEWTPPPQEIPRIREALFRAGILFYYRFFVTWEPDNKWVRDFAKPWREPDEVPEIFRSDYAHVIDPPSDWGGSKWM